MPQQDTGLGWSAKDSWLKSSVGTLCGIGVSRFSENLPVGNNEPSISEMVASNCYIYVDGVKYYLYLRGTTSGPLGIIVQSGSVGSSLWFYFASKTQGTTINSGYFLYITDGSTKWYGGGWGSSARYTNERLVNTDVFIAGDGYVDIPWSSSLETGNTICALGPYPNWLQIAANQVNPNPIYFTKKNAGFAVAAAVKWRTGSAHIVTPVLISSDRNAVEMETPDTSQFFATATRFNDGIKFYMGFYQNTEGGFYDVSVEQADLSNLGVLSIDDVFRLLMSFIWSNVEVLETVDPLEGFGHNGEDAGEVNPDPQDDDVDFDDLPTRSFSEGGFCRIFNPDLSDLNDLASYMWTDQTFLQTVINHLKQILENPIEAIISLSIVPVQPPSSSNKVPVNVMYFNTGVRMRPVTSQFVTIDCGTTVLQESFGGALDYNPYTRVQMYLPYIGTVQLDTDEVMRKTLSLKYHIDVVTGICCAELKADNKLLYHFSGHCSVSQPITSADFSGYLNAAISAAKLAVGVATGMAASTAAATAAQTPPAPSTPSSDSASTALVPVPENQALVPGRGLAPRIQEPYQPDNSKLTALWGELSKPGNLNTAAAAMGGKMVVQHSGGFSGNSGYLAKRRPYLIVTRPRIANPEEYGQHNGRPSMMYLNLGTCTGFTQVQSVHLTGFDATNPELSEISTLLKGGVLL